MRQTRVREAGVPNFIRDQLSWGAGPRAVQFLILGAKARALLQALLLLRLEALNLIDHCVHLLMKQALRILQRIELAFVSGNGDLLGTQFNLRLRQLGYRIPEQIAEWLHELSPPSAQWSVLDGGCGTGLAGPLLRPWAHRLIGVDLSSGMLEEARPCGAYDDLLQADLEPYLSGLQACHDLIVMADTVVYFGEIGPLLHHCAQALRPGGHLIFSTELLPQASVEGQGPDFRLAPTGRYQHGRQGIERRLHAAGLQILRATDLPVRLELGQAVIGQLVLAGKT